ncbi:MAG TPA: hypothetical protein PKM48_07220 [Parvularculaceae bacterium]|nr:hypothetical protein [Parvularculaceae bacterium]
MKKSRFLFGGASAIAAFFAADVFFLESVRAYLTPLSPVNPQAPLH